jgi:AP-2 complex subunit beta-1
MLDSPALNASSRRHLITANGMGITSAARITAPSVPSRSTAVPDLAPESAIPDDGPRSAVSDDPYGQLADLDFGNGVAGTGGGYETDIPRPRGAEGDLLF